MSEGHVTEGHDKYLGDGVYASFDGWQVWLDTRAQHPINRIALEPAVLEALWSYVEHLKRELGATAP